jgi:centrosomal CEP192-like protein
MLRLTQDRTRCRRKRALRLRSRVRCVQGLLLALVTGTTMFLGCGGGSAGSSPLNLTLSGNWQFTVAPPADGSYLGGLEGGFLAGNDGGVTGSLAYAVFLPKLPYPCNSGSATMTGDLNGQNVSLTAVAGTQTFTLTGMLSLDNSTMVGTYDSTAGTAGDGGPCGTVQTGLQWSAVLVPPMTGNVQGNFHSTGGAAGLNNQDFLVSGSLTQAENAGASAATVSGTLNFSNSDYPCFNTTSDAAAVYGQISGNSVTLQFVGSGGSVLGQMGEASGGDTGLNPITFDSAQGGYILHGVGPSYLVATSACPGSLDSTVAAGDYGNLCLSVGSALVGANACQQPISVIPGALTFAAQAAGTPATQTITLTNISNVTLNGLSLTLTNDPASATSFTESDVCGVEGAPSAGEPFSLSSGQACAITVTFTPECTSQCAPAFNAMLTVTSPESADNDRIFAVPVTGTGVSEDVQHHVELE